KLVHKVRFSEKTDPAKNYFEMGLNYSGGDEKPFFVTLRTSDGSDVTAGFTVTLNTKTDVVKGDITFKADASTGKAKFEVKPGTGNVKAEAPADTITLSEAFALVGLGGYDVLTQGLTSGLSDYNALELDAELAPYGITQ
ncbi:MAG: hypothetical protein AAB834_00295, partial [Patescibacteria group bacterium]